MHLDPIRGEARVIPQDWELAMQEYVLNADHQNLTIFPAFGLGDFYAETEDGERLYIVG